MKLFGGIKMTWPRVILFALITGIYTGAVMLVPAFKGTSLQDIGISYEFWVIFAVIVVTNCHKAYEAALKCFVFFLISQPLVYAVQIIAGTLEFEMGWYYYSRIWLPATFLTLPGGFIAYFCKRQDALGAVVLGLGNTIQLSLGAVYLLAAIENFPYHLLSAAVCFVSAGAMTFMIQKRGVCRLITLLVCVLLSAALIAYALGTGLDLSV